MAGMIIADPHAEGENQPQVLRRTLDVLAGKVIGFIDDTKPNFNHLVDDLAELLIERHGVAKVIKRRKRVSSHAAPDEVIDEIAQHCDAVITGAGD